MQYSKNCRQYFLFGVILHITVDLRAYFDMLLTCSVTFKDQHSNPFLSEVAQLSHTLHSKMQSHSNIYQVEFLPSFKPCNSVLN